LNEGEHWFCSGFTGPDEENKELKKHSLKIMVLLEKNIIFLNINLLILIGGFF